MSKDILASNFFELFDLPVSYDIDVGQMQQAYMALQKQAHPDRFASASDQEKRLSMQQTSWINEAQATLKDPVQRAAYMLKLRGQDINLHNETTMDAAFLMQQLQMRERLEHIKDETDPLTALDKMAKEVKQAANELMQAFSQAWEEDRLDDAREIIRKLQFMQKAKNQINTLIADIEDELMGQ